MTKPEAKQWWQSKTIVLNVLVGVLAVAEATTDALKPVLPPEAIGGVLAVVAALNVVLRVATGQPIAKGRATPNQNP